jgi:uncharacterized membrane protein (DUF2068 family)
VTILAILAFLGGILGLLGGLAIVAGAGIAGGLLGIDVTILMVLGAVAAILGLLYIVTGVGLWKMAMWGWTLGVVVSILAILQALWNFVTFQDLTSAAISIIIALIILGYLLKVKSAFRAGAPAMPSPPPSM